MKMGRVLPVTLALVLSSAVGSDASYAASVENLVSMDLQEKSNGSERVEIYDRLIASGVEEHVAERLLDKLQEGELWDSLKDDSQPVSVEHRDTGQSDVTVEIYSDGSRVINEIEKPQLIGESGLRVAGSEPVHCGQFWPDPTGFLS